MTIQYIYFVVKCDFLYIIVFMRVKLGELLLVLEKEIEKAEKRAGETKSAADEIARAAVGSFSQSGDIEHSRNQSYLVLEHLGRLRKLYEEIKSETEKDIPGKVRPACFLKVDIEGKVEEIFLVNNLVLISGVKLVSPESPLGKELISKKVREKILEIS